MSSEIKIYVACHNKCAYAKNPLIFPVHVGAALTKNRFEGMIPDNTGDNISDKNPTYCELTGQYWVWKNEKADYYGFFHNRRYFSFNPKRLKADLYQNVYMSSISDETIKELCLNEADMRTMIEKYDIIVPEAQDLVPIMPKKLKPTVYEQYKLGMHHDIKDLDYALSLVKSMYPEYSAAADKYMSSSKAYFLNMYIMKSELFQEYCSWLFPLLEKINAVQDYTNMSVYETRKTGFIAERLFGIFFTHIKDTRNIKVKEVQRTIFANLDDPYPFPAFKDNNKVIALASDNNYAKFLSITLQSIAENSSIENNYDIIVLSDGIDAYNMRILKIQMSEYKNISLRFIEISHYMTGKVLQERAHITKTTYARFVLPNIFRNFDKTIYIDCDLVLNEDIAKLFDTNINGKLLAAVRDTVMCGWYRMPKNEHTEYVNKVLGMKERPFDYFNAGVLVLNLQKFREEYPSEKLFELAETRNWKWMDQDILNYVAFGKTVHLDATWNFMAHANPDPLCNPEIWTPKYMHDAYVKARNNPKIIHYAGRAIPCYAPYADDFHYFWKYAKNSPYYELIIRESIFEANRYEMLETVYSLRFRRKIKRILLPFFNIFFPKDSKRRRGVRKAYRGLRGLD